MNFFKKITLLFVFVWSMPLAYSACPEPSISDNEAKKVNQKKVNQMLVFIPQIQTAETFETFCEFLDTLSIDLIRKGRTARGNSALHLAVMHGHPALVRKLLKYEFNIFEKNGNQKNIVAILKNRIEFVPNRLDEKKSILCKLKRCLKIIEILEQAFEKCGSSLDDDFYSNVLFSLLTHNLKLMSSNLSDLIIDFYAKYKEYINVNMEFEGKTFFDLAIECGNDRLVFEFLLVNQIDAKQLNDCLTSLLEIASQNPGTPGFLDAILDQLSLDRRSLCNAIHDNQLVPLSKQIRIKILEYIEKNCPQMLKTPEVGIDPLNPGAPRKTRPRIARAACLTDSGTPPRKLFQHDPDDDDEDYVPNDFSDDEDDA